MKTTDLFKMNRSSQRLNEGLEKFFGKKLNLESFDLPKLEDARNKLRTQIHDARSQSGFNENIENEALTQAQWMLDAINAEIAEREEFIADAGAAEASYDEGFGSIEDEVKQLLDRFEQNAMEIGAYGDVDIEAVVSLIEQGDYEGAADEVYGSYANQDGGEVQRLQPMVDDLEDEFEMLTQGGDEEGGDTDDAEAMMSAGRGDDEDYGTFPESTQGEDMRKVTEGEIQQASAIVTAKTMVDRVGRWIEELSGMENDTLLQLGDQIRDEMGAEQAKQFISTVAPAIQAALDSLKSTRETLSTGVRTLTGEEQPAEMLGSEPPADELDSLGDVEPDAMNTGDEEEMGPPDDEFAAAEPAAGGQETAGREKRESIDFQNKLLKVLVG
jgi:hypothetical protein